MLPGLEGIVKRNIADQPILDIFNSGVFQEVRRKHLQSEIASIRLCRNCFGVHSNGANWLFGRAG